MPERPSALSRGLSLPGPWQDVMLSTLSRHTSVYEITPTLAAVLLIAPSRDLRGEVLAEAFTPDAHQKLNIERIDRGLELPPPRSPTPATLDRELLEKLCSLGYTIRNGGRLRRVIEAIVCAESRPLCRAPPGLFPPRFSF